MPVFQGTIKDGQVVLATPLPYPDGTQLTVRIEPLADSPLVAMGKNAIDLGITDLAEQHDHYLYGTPKRPQ